MTILSCKDAIFKTLRGFWLVISCLPTDQKCVRFLQAFSLDLIASYFNFNDDVAVLFNMDFADSSSDSKHFAGFNLCDIEE